MKKSCQTCKFLRNALLSYANDGAIGHCAHPKNPFPYNCYPGSYIGCSRYECLEVYAESAEAMMDKVEEQQNSELEAAADLAVETGPYDPVERPSHYQLSQGVEVIDVIAKMGWLEGFCLGGAVKYLLRAGRKEGTGKVEDILKAGKMLRIWEEKR